MKSKRGRTDRIRSANNGLDSQTCAFFLLELPVAVLHQVLDLLCPDELLQLLQTSRAMAIEVMQHRAGRLTLKLKLYHGVQSAAIRQVLQWAPPSTLKLSLTNRGDSSLGDEWSIASGLFDVQSSAPPATGDLPDHNMQQLPSIAAVYISAFELHSLVPGNLVAMCPNMHTLHLSDCTVSGSGRASSMPGSSTCSARPAHRLHTLILDSTDIPGLMQAPKGNARVTRSMQQAAQYSEQLRRSLPNVTRLKLLRDQPTAQFLSVLGPQLNRLHLPDCFAISGLSACSMHLQQLQHLSMPDTKISYAADMDVLLSLPNLTRLKVNTVSEGLPKDYSSHQCKWQHLHLCLSEACLSLSALVKLPLHSLTHPLILGNATCCGRTLRLPSSAVSDSVLMMERLAQQLARCGVELRAGGVAWGPDKSVSVDGTGDRLHGVKMVPAFKAIAPAFGLWAKASLLEMTVDQPFLEALGTVYGPSLTTLCMCQCSIVEDMRAAWQSALSGLPSVAILEVLFCFFKVPELVRTVRQLATAVAQQPAGRCIKVSLADRMTVHTSARFAELVIEDAGEELSGVEVEAVKLIRAYQVYPCLQIRSKHVP